MKTTSNIDASYIQAQSEEVVERFLTALVEQDHNVIRELLHSDVLYTNVSLPTFRGGKRVAGLIKLALSSSRKLQVKNHQIVAKENIVLTERTDIVEIGPLHIGFWVCGTFKVENGKIILWRDYFDWLNVSQGLLRGVFGIGITGLRPKI
ncbi:MULTISPECIES: limonene-1,2-epoxide hydrolase family protein [unclassified Acinetobacter]|uniref:limonene-1,2-epoxide hydrolase family protein n=1 Tax=unclassified Acinetobacter TaxID=196816 RepID=UPI00244885B4|nr:MULTISPECIES: limonene-1,2-epoxide hydrolase family protein [unclassified Acinetobacter]MDH0032212.1 nuclear transport factor 2 family protein [Acinetobacter sp. GD04021]MDH0886013.1 nuclear transport factor 2 family protein [Acinetobacter sp. GD03873]MDH1082633.1 nuclear transport factor 2 family protein [Acinetobacter sp. GD03983]MDH2189572.1 nuclear transport factor 2 family protein [Acinetobacter sp. GD03645]MDH2203597.1 nuclear transport factor 2 family protein [Acinetobacter sp. GD036